MKAIKLKKVLIALDYNPTAKKVAETSKRQGQRNGLNSERKIKEKCE